MITAVLKPGQRQPRTRANASQPTPASQNAGEQATDPVEQDAQTLSRAYCTFRAKGASLAVIMIAAAIVVGSLLIGLWRLHQINQLHGEYVVALRLGRAFAPLHATLATCLHRQAIDPVASTEQQAIATKLYKKLGAITMVEYRSQCCKRQRVLRELREAQRAAGPAVDP